MIVVIGATGNVGRPLLAALPDARPVSRRTGADLADPASLRPAFAGAEAMFLMVPGAGGHLDTPAILGEASAAGIKRIVLLSSQAAGTRPGWPSHAPLRALEDQVKAAVPSWTVLRPGGFASNAFGWAESVRARRTVAAPYAGVALPIVDPDDIAAVAAAALLDERHAGRTYVLTGPEATTPRQRAQAIGEAIGAPVEFVEQSPEEARAQLLGFMPEVVADGTLAILGTPEPQERAVSPDVERVLGRPAGTFAAWARRNAAAFR
ncbi:NAD(P)H-binding protein [Dactylosporangium sp. McL0621]|uniref:NmrA family NAD(P)-binding protein n=1 Tax=Dactylosporangium sp. McL0621 TaxID=3415678 RepID=UPI003CF92C68